MNFSALAIIVVTVAVVNGHIRSGFWYLSLPMELTRKTVQRSTCLRLIPYFAKLMLESEKCIFAELPSLAEKSRVL